MLKKLFVGVLLLLFVCFLIYELLHLGPLLTNGKLGGGGGGARGVFYTFNNNNGKT